MASNGAARSSINTGSKRGSKVSQFGQFFLGSQGKVGTVGRVRSSPGPASISLSLATIESKHPVNMTFQPGDTA